MSDVWELISIGAYEQAAIAYTEAISIRDNGFLRRNRSTAYLLLKRYDDAFHDIMAAEALEPVVKPGYFHGDAGQLRLGVIEWVSGDYDAACDRWLRIGTALKHGRVVYTDASGGIGTASILFFGAARSDRIDLCNLAKHLIKKTLKRPTYNSWPLPLGALYDGRIDCNECLASVAATSILHDRQLCQAYFAIAVKALASSDRASYYQQMALAASLSRAVHEDEYFLAQYETDICRGA